MNHTMTGRMTSSAPAFQNLPKNRPGGVLCDPADLDLLDKLAQPTAYERVMRRRRALDRYMFHVDRLAQLRLEGDQFSADLRGQLVEQYRTMYKFTEEEINARIEATHPGAEG